MHNAFHNPDRSLYDARSEASCYQSMPQLEKSHFWIGCALWGYKEWVGTLFPAGSRSSDFLQLYSDRFTSVEGNTTFYSVPDEKTVLRWAQETSPGFKFCPKLPKQLTHKGLLTPNVGDTQKFIERMQNLGDRLGPIFAQLPPSYSPSQWVDLKQFLSHLPTHEVELALEVRHLDWFQPPFSQHLSELLTDLGIGRVLLDTRPIYDVPDNPQLASEQKKPRVPVEFSVTAQFSLIRYISHPNWEMNLIFLQDWLNVLEQWLQQGVQVYFFVHCPLEQRSPDNAQSIQALFEQHALNIPELPWNRIQQEPHQLNLF